jgi:hypothetical protein
MRKIHIIDLVEDFLAGGDAPADVKGKYHREILTKWIELAWNSLINTVYDAGKANGDYDVLDPWARNYPLSIVSNSVTLPYPPIHLSDGAGILQVADGRDSNFDPTNVYAPISTTAYAVFNDLEAGNQSTVPMWYLEISNTNAHVLKIVNKPTATTGVTVKMVIPLERVDDFTHVSVPKEGGKMIIQEVMSIIRQKNTEDRINDNNPET